VPVCKGVTGRFDGLIRAFQPALHVVSYPEIGMWTPAHRALVRDSGFDDALMSERLPSPWLCKRALSGASGKLCGLRQERDAGLAARAMAAPMAPVEGMAVGVPVLGRLRDSLGDVLPGLEATPGQGERA
jgi:hypothetical protein